MRYFILIIILLSTLACAKQYIPLKGNCLPEPSMKKVTVQYGTIDRLNTKHVINNHIKSWEYIEYLKIKGCR